MSKQPDVYLYLDSAGIDSLFAQTVERVETEFSESRKTGIKDSAGVKFGLGKAIVALLGLQASAKLDMEKMRSKLESSKSTLTVQNKLTRLFAYLRASEKLLLNIAVAVMAAVEQKSSVFLECQDEFDMPQMAGGIIDRINEDGAVLFEITTFGRCRKLSMVASLAKFPRVRNERLGRLSHEALLFQKDAGHQISINLFGNLRKINAAQGHFQVKPFALWT
jgi:hypothetical protein